MKVKQLIEVLNKYNGDAEVMIGDDDASYFKVGNIELWDESAPTFKVTIYTGELISG